MAGSLKNKFENLAAEQAHDPTKHTIEIPDPSSGWMHSGNSGGGHTAHDGKYKTRNSKLEVVRKPAPGGPAPKKSFSDLP